MSAIVNRKMSVQIMPRMSFRFPSMMSEALLETELQQCVRTYPLVQYL